MKLNVFEKVNRLYLESLTYFSLSLMKANQNLTTSVLICLLRVILLFPVGRRTSDVKKFENVVKLIALIRRRVDIRNPK